MTRLEIELKSSKRTRTAAKAYFGGASQWLVHRVHSQAIDDFSLVVAFRSDSVGELTVEILCPDCRRVVENLYLDLPYTSHFGSIRKVSYDECESCSRKKALEVEYESDIDYFCDRINID